VAGEYVDNDISAYSGMRRPEYEGPSPSTSLEMQA
jgi:hypothetical protein